MQEIGPLYPNVEYEWAQKTNLTPLYMQLWLVMRII